METQNKNDCKQSEVSNQETEQLNKVALLSKTTRCEINVTDDVFVEFHVSGKVRTYKIPKELNTLQLVTDWIEEVEN